MCERFDVGLSALRQRAAREDWRRSDQADPAPNEVPREPTPGELDDDPPLTSAEMAELTLKRARRAMLEGRVREAQIWTKVHESWRKLAAEDADAARRAAEAAETPEQTFASRMERRDYNDRLQALMRADQVARAAAEDEADDLDEAEVDAGPDLHEVHDLHAGLQTKTAGTPLNATGAAP